jgi:hypothetical protein
MAPREPYRPLNPRLDELLRDERLGKMPSHLEMMESLRGNPDPAVVARVRRQYLNDWAMGRLPRR